MYRWSNPGHPIRETPRIQSSRMEIDQYRRSTVFRKQWGHHDERLWTPGHQGTLQTCRNIKIRQIPERLQDPSESIQELLCITPSLRRFHSIATRNFVEATLDARDIVPSEWVCSSLESLTWKITYIPRPDLAFQSTIEEFIANRSRFELEYGPTLATSFSSLSLGYSVDESRNLQA